MPYPGTSRDTQASCLASCNKQVGVDSVPLTLKLDLTLCPTDALRVVVILISVHVFCPVDLTCSTLCLHGHSSHPTRCCTPLLTSLHNLFLTSLYMTHHFSILPTHLRSGEHRGGRRGPHRLRELSESGDTGGIHRNPDGSHTSIPLFPSLFHSPFPPPPFPPPFPYLLLSSALVLHVLIA